MQEKCHSVHLYKSLYEAQGSYSGDEFLDSAQISITVFCCDLSISPILYLWFIFQSFNYKSIIAWQLHT